MFRATVPLYLEENRNHRLPSPSEPHRVCQRGLKSTTTDITTITSVNDVMFIRDASVETPVATHIAQRLVPQDTHTAMLANVVIARINALNAAAHPQPRLQLKKVEAAGGPLPPNTVPVLPNGALGLQVRATHLATFDALLKLTANELDCLSGIYQNATFALEGGTLY